MNRRMILYLICQILRIEAVTMIPAAVIAIVQKEYPSLIGFIFAMLAMGGVSLLSAAFRVRKKEIYARDGFLTVSLAWIAVSLFGALPFWISGEIPNFIDCIFETVSGFTTTGASVVQNVEALPMSLLYWRSFTHWLGGMGVLVFLLAIIPIMKGKSTLVHLLRAESPGPSVDKLAPKLHQTAKILYGIYIALTMVQILILLAGGMPLFDSVTTSFATAGTGGFAIKNDSMAGYSPFQQGVVTVFMALFGVNFNIFYLLLLRQFSRVFRNQELRLYLGTMIGAILLITWNVLPQFDWNPGTAAHHVAFTVSSVMTTTGFATVDFNQWPMFSKTILVILMIFGACAGSTGGGIKSIRVLILFKEAKRNIRKMLRPRSVSAIHVDGAKVDDEVVHGVHDYLTVYTIISIASLLLIAIDNFSMETSLTAVLACLNNIGPGLDLVGPMGNYACFSAGSKLILSLDMLIGRLEIFPMLMLAVPVAWKR